MTKNNSSTRRIKLVSTTDQSPLTAPIPIKLAAGMRASTTITPATPAINAVIFEPILIVVQYLNNEPSGKYVPLIPSLKTANAAAVNAAATITVLNPFTTLITALFVSIRPFKIRPAGIPAIVSKPGASTIAPMTKWRVFSENTDC